MMIGEFEYQLVHQKRRGQHGESDGQAPFIRRASKQTHFTLGIAAPAWGVRTGDIQGDFAHFVGYPDMKAALADQSDIATKGGWKERRDYFSSYANCSGENLWKFDIANIPAS